MGVQEEGSSIRKRKGKIQGTIGAKSYSQRHEIDYDEVFSPVVRHTSIRAALALVANQDLKLEQLDVKTAFLHGIWRKRFSLYNQRGSSNLV